MSKPEIILNADLDTKALAKDYKANSFTQISDLMNGEAAERTLRCMAEEIEWSLLYIDKGTLTMKTQTQLKQQTERRRIEMYTRIYEWAQFNYQALNYVFGLQTAHDQGQLPDLYLHKVHDFLNSKQVLDTVMAITGEKKLTRADATCCLQSSDHFRKTYENTENLGKRRIGFSLDLTKGWHPNWGGYFQFYDEDGNIKKGFKPTFNSLTLYKEPQGNSVSYISVVTGKPRTTLTGWFWAE
jgi:SM-20-related protein